MRSGVLLTMGTAFLAILVLVLTWLIGKLAGVALFASSWMVKLAIAVAIVLLVIYVRSRNEA